VAEDLLNWFRASYEQGSAAFNDGDLQTALGWLPEELEWHAVSADPEQQLLRGPAEVIRWFEEFRSVFDDWRIEPLGFEQPADGAVLVDHVIRGTSRAARVPVEVRTYELWEFDGTRPVRVRQFFSREEALAAASA
jgi:hypothetical protein